MSATSVIKPPLRTARRVYRRLRRWLNDGYVQAARTFPLRRLSRDEERLVVCLTPGYGWPSGGVLSIASLFRESLGLRDVHRAAVVLCTIPGDPAVLRYTWFENRNDILGVNAVLRRCPRLQSVLVHVPEYAVNRLIAWLESDASARLRRVEHVHINVLVQNIDKVTGQNVAGLLRFGRVTCTTAHEAYTTLAVRRSLGVPLHRLLVSGVPIPYRRVPYEQKEHLLVVSPDRHPLKTQILGHIAAACPDLKIQIIRNLSYAEYRDLIGRAKWSLTFGEGLDGYFVEPVCSGGVSFAVYNDRFFTPAFSALETVYASWDALERNIAADLRRLDSPEAYRACSNSMADLLTRMYSAEKFRSNLRDFYSGDYTFP